MDKETWNNLVARHDGEFLQSWEWGEFQESLGRQVLRITEPDVGLAQIIISRLPLGLSWAYVPRGPIFIDPAKAHILINKIAKIVPPKTVFIDFELLTQADLNLPQFDLRQPRRTLVLGLTETEKDLLEKMHPKTRYSIRLAQKKKLTFKEVGSADFYKVLTSTVQRQGFRSYPKSYFKKMPGSAAKFLGVFDKNKIVAAGCFYIFNQTATYLHGGSDYVSRALMAPYLLHWGAIRYFKNQGLKWYDFWGIDQIKWPGVTRFKIRFGGQVKTYPGAYVKILKPFWFKIYNVAKR